MKSTCRPLRQCRDSGPGLEDADLIIDFFCKEYVDSGNHVVYQFVFVLILVDVIYPYARSSTCL